MDKAGISTLSERRESLYIKLFKESVKSNEHHKLANVLPPMASSNARRLRNETFLYSSISHRSSHEPFYYWPRDVRDVNNLSTQLYFFFM